MANTLYKACKATLKDGKSGTHSVGDNNIYFEYYTQDDIDTDVEKITYKDISACDFGNDNEENVVLVASEDITIPSGFTLTPAYPKKSMVILCKNFVNNGTVSMTGKAPNVLPHTWYIVGKTDGYSQNVIIPAYADNAVIYNDSIYMTNSNNDPYSGASRAGLSGIAGTNRQCGSGGCGNLISADYSRTTMYMNNSGSGYAFGGGAGSGGSASAGFSYYNKTRDVDSTYPMRGTAGIKGGNYSSNCGAYGGVGNPSGGSVGTLSSYSQNIGCGGRIIIFCESFINNGIIEANGVDSSNVAVGKYRACGGASGGGAVDIFYATSGNLNSDSITANGGAGCSNGYYSGNSGDGGNGCVTLSNGKDAPVWTMQDIFKPVEKYMSKENMEYFLGELVKRINANYL